MHLHPLDCLLRVRQSRRLELLVRIADELVDFLFVVEEERVHVFLVDFCGALGAGEDEVQVQEEAEPGVEGNPAEDEVEGAFEGEDDGGDDPVHEPGREVCWVGGPECFVGHEDGKEDRDEGAVR